MTSGLRMMCEVSEKFTSLEDDEITDTILECSHCAPSINTFTKYETCVGN